MKKSLVSLLLAATANVLIAIPAIASYANSGAQPYYAPSHNEDGGCREAGYAEDDMTLYYYWSIPALADGESVSIPSTVQHMSWTAPWQPPAPWQGYEYTFTCNNGTLSSPNTSQYGGWD
ncbi:hypothetical protein [Roseateles sp. LYH14W]|uniref:Chitin-binding type-4 domain-containing protein n=1 Tax=Pelomonas parva TaxID=3299032 RepID=A0ABW7FAA4_9BURK